MKKSLLKMISCTVLSCSVLLSSVNCSAFATETSDNDMISPQVQEILEESKEEISQEQEKAKELQEDIKVPKSEDIKLPCSDEEETPIIEEHPDELRKPDSTSSCKIKSISNLTSDSQERNTYPIVLVHGFLGYGRDELLGVQKYWGGIDQDVEQALNDKGLTTYTATVGPISSNWDRACELYAYIVGGTVDYGEAHSKNRHNRYGRTFEGLYKNISNENKIHLVGHSMGGQTVRMLTQLLSEGSEEEREATPEDELSPLFKGGNDWIASVTTISTPNDGTTLADLIPGKSLVNMMGKQLAAILGDNDFTKNIYDLKLDQFGLERKAGESQSDYIKRVLDSGQLWNNNNDIATYDLSTKGAEEINKWVKTQPNVYYFSFTTDATRQSLVSNHQHPMVPEMAPAFYGTSALIGRYTRDDGKSPKIDESWFPNDGVVNTISQNGPKLGVTEEEKNKIVDMDFNGTPQIGKWNSLPVLKGFDHMDIVGSFADVNDWYIGLAKELRSLPKNN